VKLAVVIVHYNASADLDRCLESLTACAPRFAHEIIIVDNASQDEGLAEVHRNYREFRWVFSQENTGYSRGVNLGMEQVEAEYYLVLNPDIVVQPGALDRLVEFADQSPRAGIIGPQLLNEDGSLQESCRRFYTLNTLLLRRTFLGKIFPNSETVRRYLMQDFDHQSSRPVDWVLGGCILVRRSAMDRTGPMDERFFLYFEDVDWCYRMWQAGHEVLYTPDARFMHRHRRDSARGTFNRTFWMHLGSLISFYEKWGMLVWLAKKWRGPLMVTLLWAADMLGLLVAFGAAYGLRGMADRLMPGLFAEDLFPFGEYRPLLLFSMLVASVTFLMTGRYRARRQRRPRPFAEHFKQMGAVALLLMASSYLGHLEVVSRAVLLAFVPLLAVTTLLAELTFRTLMGRLEKGRLSLERTLLVGSPAVLGSWLAETPDLSDTLLEQGVDVAGYLGTMESATAGLPPLAGGAIPWLGHADEILEVVRRYRISQVVFWSGPDGSEASWKQLAGLRRLRVRLCWQVPEVWLLAARSRTEVFGSGLSAVKESSGGAFLQTLGRRMLGILTALVLGLLSWPFWLLLRVWRLPRGSARREKVTLTDVWGHDPTVSLVQGAQGNLLPLWWQWGLVSALWRGSLAPWGPRAVPEGEVEVPRDSAQILAFWQAEPAAPGLTGPWATSEERGWLRFKAIWCQFWKSPAGLDHSGSRRLQEMDILTPSRSTGEVEET
jgi:GT2 family glycosyltransferase